MSWEQVSNAVVFYAHYVASKTGKTGLTPTVDVYRNGSSIVTAANATEVGGGLYSYSLASGSVNAEGEYVAIFKTSDSSVDQQWLPALWIVGRAGVEDLDATISSRSTYAGGAVASVTGNVGGNVTGSVASVTSGVTVTTNNDKSGYSLMTTPPTAAAIADAVWDEATADHQTAGTTGKALSTAGSAADPLTNTVPGSYASGTAGAALGRIGSGQITTTSIVAQSGNVTTVAGDDYNATDGRAIDWTDSSASWPDLTGASILVTVKSGSTTLMAKAGSVVTPTGASKQVRVQPTAADTRAIGVGTYDFDVQATLASGRIVTLLTGYWTNQVDYSA